MRLLILGAPGVGKGSQAARISKALSIPHISTGDIFREHISKKTDIGIMVKDTMDRGMLVSDAVTVRIVMERLSRDDCANGFVLDGFPRNVQQATSLDRILDAMDTRLDAIINILLDDENIISRITGRSVCSQCGEVFHLEARPPLQEGLCDICEGVLFRREDDTVEIVRNRLSIYHQQTKPVVDYYAGTAHMVRVQSCQGIDETSAGIFTALGIEMSSGMRMEYSSDAENSA